MAEDASERLAIGRRLVTAVLEPMKAAFVGKDEVIDLLGVCLVGGENLFLLGPPGTAKSALVQDLGRRLAGTTFDYLLTRFTEPSELFGPFDIRRLREGDLVTNTEGMLPEASFVFLDELLNANSAVLNSLLTVLNERVFRRGRETRSLPLVMTVGASNHLPEDDALGALFDRFLLRVHCDNVPGDRLSDVLDAGWRLERRDAQGADAVSLDDVRRLATLLTQVDVQTVRAEIAQVVLRLRRAGITVSDRRAVKMQRLVAASALLCGRLRADRTDLWVFRHIWDTLEQEEVIAAVVDEALGDSESADAHPRARRGGAPDPEVLLRDLDDVADRLQRPGLSEGERAAIRDHLTLLAARCQWVKGGERRTFLLGKVDELWASANGPAR